jgi:hypothetical protein
MPDKKNRNGVKILHGREWGAEKSDDYVIVLLGNVQMWISYQEWAVFSEAAWEANRA